MERSAGTLSHQHSRQQEELQAYQADLPLKKNRWAVASLAALSMQKEQAQALTSPSGRSHFPRYPLSLALPAPLYCPPFLRLSSSSHAFRSQADWNDHQIPAVPNADCFCVAPDAPHVPKCTILPAIMPCAIADVKSNFCIVCTELCNI